MKDKRKIIIKKAGIALLIYGLTTLMALGLWEIRTPAENIIMFYLVSLMILMIEIKKYSSGVIYTVVCIKPVSFQKVVEEAYSAYQKASEKRSFLLSMPKEPIIVEADREMIVKAVSNIPDNALSHTPEDAGVKIALTSAQGYGRLEITDGGGGIPPKVIRDSLVKESFQDMDEESKGLRICRSIIEVNGGKLVINTNLSHGTAITVLLKLAGQKNGSTSDTGHPK